ncbi:hypothetical protein [Ohtaekwangia koreensis]|uniref:hypothetical protein n=1 Tax=Ohtaekwangia koreensis TaxID=688867 RepID=UPI0013563D92|nr:hypothetical protein [Ohtaekwangia koreensis]
MKKSSASYHPEYDRQQIIDQRSVKIAECTTALAGMSLQLYSMNMAHRVANEESGIQKK